MELEVKFPTSSLSVLASTDLPRPGHLVLPLTGRFRPSLDLLVGRSPLIRDWARVICHFRFACLGFNWHVWTWSATLTPGYSRVGRSVDTLCLRCSDLMYGGCFTEFSVYIDISKLSFFFVIPVLLVPPCLLQHDGESLSHHELNKPEVSHVHHILNRAPRHAHSVAHVPGDVGSVTRDLIPGKGTDLSLRTCRMLSHVHHVPDHAPDLIHCVAPSPGDVKCVARTLTPGPGPGPEPGPPLDHTEWDLLPFPYLLETATWVDHAHVFPILINHALGHPMTAIDVTIVDLLCFLCQRDQAWRYRRRQDSEDRSYSLPLPNRSFTRKFTTRYTHITSARFLSFPGTEC